MNNKNEKITLAWAGVASMVVIGLGITTIYFEKNINSENILKQIEQKEMELIALNKRINEKNKIIDKLKSQSINNLHSSVDIQEALANSFIRRVLDLIGSSGNRLNYIEIENAKETNYFSSYDRNILKKLSEDFSKFDKNEDGKLNKNEIAKLF